MSLFVGIEAIALRHSTAVVSDSHGRLAFAARRVGEPIILHSMDRALVRRRLFELLRDLCTGCGLSLDDLRGSAVCLGMAGAVFPSELRDLQEEFARLELNIGKLTCRADTDIIMTSHLRSSEGSIILCGSSAAVMISKAGKVTRTGGWGPAIGERGSGYWIGRQAIVAVANELLAGAPQSLLWSCIDRWLRECNHNEYPDLRLLCICWSQYLERHGGTTINDIRSLFLAFVNQASIQHHHAWRCMVSTLAQPVIEAAAAGGVVAQEIINESVDQLVNQYLTCTEIANGGIPLLPIVLYGGILNHHPHIRDQLQVRLCQKFGGELLFVSRHTPAALRPACGALLIALGSSTEDTILMPRPEIVAMVENTARNFENEFSGLNND